MIYPSRGFPVLCRHLQEAGVKVYFPFPSKRYVGEMCDKLLNEIERRKLEEQIPGVIIVKLSENGSGGEMFQGPGL